MSQTPDQPGAEGSSHQPQPQPEHPAQPSPSAQPGSTAPGATPQSGARPQPGPAQQPVTPQHPGQQRDPYAATAASGTARPSMWRQATSSTGGKIAIAFAAASVVAIGLLVTALVVGVAAWKINDERRDGTWTSESRQGPWSDRDDDGPRQGAPDQNDPAPSLPGMPGMPGPNGPGDGSGQPQPGVPGMGSALHGEAVIPNPTGNGTLTVLFQSGDVTEITTDKLTVKSTDGFSATYTIGADSRQRLQSKESTLAKGEQVIVLAGKDDTTTLRILKTGAASGSGTNGSTPAPNGGAPTPSPTASTR